MYSIQNSSARPLKARRHCFATAWRRLIGWRIAEISHAPFFTPVEHHGFMIIILICSIFILYHIILWHLLAPKSRNVSAVGFILTEAFRGEQQKRWDSPLPVKCFQCFQVQEIEALGVWISGDPGGERFSLFCLVFHMFVFFTSK